ncbi:response regulator [Paractinoplanes maris]|uniref:response regulator n=1 Tax=Paractinoplanes maris TaxID=1734446 RepID=UPI00202287AA|nr:response regulator transcription factor [Actinoplanes maris]
MIRVLVADDQPLLRSGFSLILNSDPDIEVAGQAADGVQALAAARVLRPDLVLMDIRMPEMDGIEATRHLTTSPQTAGVRVLVLTTFDTDEYVYHALRAGASGFLLKDVAPVDLIAAVKTVARGEALLSPHLTRRLIEHYVGRDPGTPQNERPASPTLPGLTQRELDVLAAVARGLSNMEISAEMYVSYSTVKTHVSHLLTKLGARDRAQLVMLAYRSGLIRP